MEKTKTVHLPKGDWVEVPLTPSEQLYILKATERKQRGIINAIKYHAERAIDNATMLDPKDILAHINKDSK